MRQKPLRRVITGALTVLLAVGTMGLLAPPATAQEAFKVLVFSKTAGFRHASIPQGIAAIEQLGQQNDFAVDATEDAGAFTTENLSQYSAVIWLSTTGDVLNSEQQTAFERYIRSGGGYVGIHAASDTEYEWPWYGKLVGAYFDSHPAIQEAAISVTDRVHPSTRELPKRWVRTDEWYNYRANPRGDVHVLAELEESSYSGGSMGEDHPTAWCHEYDGGRAWYTGGGHTSESYSDPLFLRHVLGGIKSAAGQAAADCGATVDANFDQVTLAKGAEDTGEPMGLAVLPDGSALHTSRDGTVRHTTADGETSVAADIPVYNHDEDGLQGIAVDPNFAQNHWVYAYYAPPLDTPAGDAPDRGDGPADFEAWKGHNNLSRFKFEDGTLDLSSEQVLLTVDQDRGQCCHNGGDLDFDADGNLYLSTGDDTNPFQSQGYAPIDERQTRNPVFDAQRSAANTNDLRGKILRIHPEPDGSYTIPAGNMFPESEDADDQTRPEVYAMGFRNPFRMSVDEETGTVYVGDYGPDAGSADPQRGPAGQVEFNRVTGPGFYGWPYCTGTNTVQETYTEWDFATQTAGAKFDCQGGPQNDSFRNTGKQQLPPAQDAWIAYDGCAPELGCGSESPMGGPVYHYDADNPSPTKFPAHYDGKFFAYEWGRGWIKTATVADDGSALDVDPFFASMELTRPMDVEFGPNGSLYVLDYGSGFFGGSPESAVYRIDYVKGQRSPTAVISADPTSGQAPLTVQFSSEGSDDPDPGDTLTYAWDFDGDGTTDSTEPNPSYTYQQNGAYDATLTVSDPDGKTGTANQTITVGNTAPQVEITLPPNGGLFGFGDQVDYKVEVTDPDGQPVDCSKVEVEYILGHDEHGHPLSTATGCEGTLETAEDGGHDAGADLVGVIHASYTDTPPEPGLPALSGEDEAVLQPRHKQAEHWSRADGVQTVSDGGAEGGTRVGYIENGDWVSFTPYNLANVEEVSVRGASGGAGGRVELRANSPEGPLVAEPIQITNTGGYGNWQTFGPVPVTDTGGTVELFMVFKGTGTGGLFDVDSLTFHGRGAASNTRPSVSAQADPTEGSAPLTVKFSATATDPDGGELTYAWDFDGDGTTDANTLEAAHTYQEPGEYTATFTATDGKGLADSERVDITAYRALPECEKPHPNLDPDDEFDGEQLDTCRWTDIVRQDADHFRLQDGRLQIDALPGDMYGGNTSARNLLLQDLPRGTGWEAVTKLTLDSTDDYAQAGLMVYGNDDSFAKAMLINVPGQGLRYEFAQQVDGQPVFTADYDRSGPLPDDWPKTSYVKVEYDGQGLTASYSADGESWTEFGRVRSLRAIPDPKIGLGAFNGDGKPVSFDYFHLDKQPAKPCTPTPPEEGYEPLFNGTEPSLEKWHQAGPGGFLYADCELLSYGGLGLYWFDQEFSSYSLKLDWQVAGDDNSGIFVGSPRPGDDPWLAVREGEEIQIDMTDDPDSTTGAIYNEQAADAAKRDAALRPPGEWNTYEIVVRNDTITVFLNGVKINEWVDDDPNVDLDQGYVGIQNHGSGDDVSFRNVRIKELSSSSLATGTRGG